MKRLSWFTTAFLFLAAVSYGGETIRFMACNHSWTEGIKPLIPQFEKETGIKVLMEPYGEDQLMQKLTVEFTSGSSDIDVFMTRPQQDSRLFLKNGWLEDLTPYFKDDKEYDFGDFTPGAVSGTLINGVQTSMPIVTEVHVLYYRKDLFDAKGLKPPKTFEEMEEAARILDDKENEIAGFMARGARSPSVTVFVNYLFGYGGDFYDQENMVATIDTPEFLAAADYYGRMLRNYGPPGVLNMSWPQCAAVFAQGKAAMYSEASSTYPNMMDPARSTVAGKTEVTLFPRGPKAHNCFDITSWGLSMSKSSTKKDAVWKFIRYMTTKEANIFVQGENGTQCARKSAFQDPRGTRTLPASWVEAVAASAAIGVGHDRPLITQVAQARDIIGEAITDAIEGKDYKASTKRAQAQFQELLDREKAEMREK